MSRFPLICCLVAWTVPGVTRAEEAAQVSHAVEVIAEIYGDRADAAQLYRAALEGMALELDALTSRKGHAVLSHTERLGVDAWLDGTRHGIAAEFTVVAGQGIVLTDVYPSGPAEAAGLEPGDLVVAMDDRPFTGLSAEQILAVAASSPSAEVTLDVLRPEGLRRLPVVRGPWQLDTARRVQHDDVAVLRLPFFGPRSAEAVREALAEHEEGSPLVIDLRTNEGGRVSAMAEVAGLFLPPSATVVTIVDASGAQRAVHSEQTEPLESIGPLVILVGRDTAGTAEAFAASLRHHRGARLVGSTTAGRDGLPRWVELEGGLYLQIVADGLRAPDGRSWAPQGLLPDVLSQPVGRPMPVKAGELPADVQLDAACHLAAQSPDLTAGH